MIKCFSENTVMEIHSKLTDVYLESFNQHSHSDLSLDQHLDLSVLKYSALGGRQQQLHSLTSSLSSS